MAALHSSLELTIPPARHPTTLLTWTNDLLRSTLSPIPFYDRDWRLPLGPSYPIVLRTFTSITSLVPASLSLRFPVRRMERTASASAQRTDIARAERAAPASARRVDE